MVKQITRPEINSLAEDILKNLNPGSKMILRNMGFINGAQVVNALMEDQGVEELIE